MSSSRSSLIFVFAAFGCTTQTIGQTRDDVGADAAKENDGAQAAKCPGPGYGGTPPTQDVVHVSATVVDETGAPVPDMLAQACGVNVCVNGTTNANGVVVIDTNSRQQRPAFKYGDGKTHAKFALALSGTPVDVDLGEQRTIAFDPPSSGVALVAGTTASSNGVELELSTDLAPVRPDPFDFDTPDLRKFRAAMVRSQPAPEAVDPSLGFEMIVALTPSATELCPPAKLTVPNSANWTAGSDVEVYVHGIDVGEEWAPYGGWAKVSDAVVSSDGATVSTVEGEGLPVLSIVGLRLKP